MATALEQADLEARHPVQPALGVLPLGAGAGIGAEKAQTNGVDMEQAAGLVVDVFEPETDCSGACHGGEDVSHGREISAAGAGPARQLRLQRTRSFVRCTAGHEAACWRRHHRGKFVR